jgi:peptidyl-prolyl cis-trans isomerase SurA
MRVVVKLLIVGLVTLLFTSCATKHSEIVVADFDGNKIYLGDFENAYAKNVGGTEIAMKDSVEDYKKFLDLYVTYKMKLRSAYVRGYESDEDLINELNEYKEKVGISYIEEKQIVVPGLKRFYDQRSEEVRVSHIMIKKVPNSDAELTKIEGILDSIKNGASFEAMVKKYSQDNFSKQTGGDIYWFTAGQIVPEFEVAAYATPVGEVYPKIVKTKFGYHIIKVTDREKRRYKLRAKHILIKNAEEQKGMVDAIPGEKPFVKISKIREEIVNGADFDSLARKYSDDPGSGAKGGDLGFFERRMMVKPFDEAVFALKIGELSEIIKTRFGYHIIQLTEELEYPSYEEEVDKIREMYKKSRYEFDYNTYLDSAKKDLNYKLNEDVIAKITSDKGGITLTPEYKEDKLFAENKDLTIITIGTDNYTVGDFFEYLSTQQKFSGKELKKPLLESGIKEYSKNLILSKKALELEKNDPEFASLMDDYKNGIFIFKLQEDEVWNKVKIDSAKLRANYEAIKGNADSVKTFEESLPELSSSYQESESKRLEKKYIDDLKRFYEPEYFYDELEKAYKKDDE